MEESSMPNKLKKQERQMTFWESESCIVPQTATVQVVETKLSNVSEGKAGRPSRDLDESTSKPSVGIGFRARLDRITQRAQRDRTATFNNLYTLLTYELLYDAFCQLKPGKAPGVDGQTLEDYRANVIDNLRSLETRLHRQTYQPQPSLRRMIPKGNGKFRPLGISCIEDKIVQRAVVAILERIYEVDFIDSSYGFRPKRSCHQALSHLGDVITCQRVNFISDADIKGFFDNVNLGQLIELLQKRIADPRMLQLIEKFLHAGVMIEGKREATDLGVPQGSSLSPLLANVYLHYVLDDWFENTVRHHLRGAATIVRYADDFICTFEYESDARRFQEALGKRLGRYGLELAEEKTKLIRFGRFARRDSQRLGEESPSTFDFLGFTHYCGHSRAGKFKLKRRTAKKKFRQKIVAMKDWFRANLTTPMGEVWPVLNAKLQGHYQYYHVNDNWEYVYKFREVVRRLGLRWLRRRSQKGQISRATYAERLEHYPLAVPGRITDLIAMARMT
jgi:group II intron reverse transcriptase/maturase